MMSAQHTDVMREVAYTPACKTEISKMGENRRKPCRVCMKNGQLVEEHIFIFLYEFDYA